MALTFEAWFDPLRTEYLETFIPQGGGAVRFAVTAEPNVPILKDRLVAAGREAGLHVVELDTATTKLHMLHTAFFAISASLDWNRLIQARLETLVADAGYVWPRPGHSESLSAIAAHNGITPVLLRTTMQKQFTSAVWNDARLAQDFRKAVMGLLDAHLTDDENGFASVILDWLRGDLRQLWLLRSIQVASKINRQNARAMLISLCHWLRACGQPGLLVLLDLRQMLLDRRELAGGIVYTPAAVMDCYEVIRQIIDDAEHFEGMLLIALSGPRLVNDEVPKRRLPTYTALNMRVWDDVRPSGRDNPLAPLVLIES